MKSPSVTVAVLDVSSAASTCRNSQQIDSPAVASTRHLLPTDAAAAAAAAAAGGGGDEWSGASLMSSSTSLSVNTTPADDASGHVVDASPPNYFEVCEQ